MQIDGTNYINNIVDKWSTAATTSNNRQALKQSESMNQNDTTLINDISNTSKTDETQNADKNDQTKKVSQENKEKSSKKLDVDNTVLSFERHKETGDIIVKIVNKDTGEVVREIPPEKILDCIAQLWKISGFNVDKKI